MPFANQVYVQYTVPFLADPAPGTYWMAVMRMLHGGAPPPNRSADALRHAAPSTGVLNNPENFARAFTLELFEPRHWTARSLLRLLRDGPAAFLGQTATQRSVVIGGIATDGTLDGTWLSIFDPYPPGRGTRQLLHYRSAIRVLPFNSMYVVQRRK